MRKGNRAMKAVTKIRKPGNSLAVVIPANMARHAGFEYGQEVEVELGSNGEIIIRAVTHSVPDMSADINTLGYKELSEEVLALGSFVANAGEHQAEDADKARSRLIRIAGRLSALSAGGSAPVAAAAVQEMAPEIKEDAPKDIPDVTPSVREPGIIYEWVVEYVDKSGVSRADAVSDSLSDVWEEALNGGYEDSEHGYLHPVLSLQRAGAGLVEGRCAYVVNGRLMTHFGDTPTSGLTNDAVPFEFHQELEQLVNDTGRIPVYFNGKSDIQLSI